ncbi:hypothetical protein QBZ16_003964 [Prototheca wickerhamii]|uniref:Protein kinase domain-containing protein n=1 Tax=Prototheca wickerhamii TaxID=3111 RepID=A0AAD9IGP5_PROWI|nr:hypothetical protein QBZ16_003964 [Prototheca wickerhamii]
MEGRRLGAVRLMMTALLSFKGAITNANSLVALATWTSSSSSPCGWIGITCDESGSVTTINLLDVGASGTLTDSLATLQSVTTMQFAGNKLTGDVPDSWNAGGALPALNTLNLSGNLILGLPTDFGSGGCTKLEVLDLSSNIINGTLPGSLSLTQLSQASFALNALTGTLPTWSGVPATAVVTVLPQGVAGGLCGAVPDSPAFSYVGGSVSSFLDNSLRSCFVACSTTTTQSLSGTNLFDVAVRAEVTAWDLATYNSLQGGQGSATKVTVPCYGTGSPSDDYLGGDAAYGQLAVTASGDTAAAGVTSQSTDACYTGTEAVVIDLGHAYALGAVVVVTGSGGIASGSVVAGAEPSGSDATACSGTVAASGAGQALADCTGVTGRYVYPVVSNAALGKTVTYTTASATASAAFGGSTSGLAIAGAAPQLVIDLGYTATDVAAVVITSGSGIGGVSLSASNPLVSSSRRRSLLQEREVSGASSIYSCTTAGSGRYLVIDGASSSAAPAFDNLQVFAREAPDENAPPAPPPPGGGRSLVSQLLFIGGTVDTFQLTQAADRKTFVDAINAGFGEAINASGYALSPAYTTIESASAGVSASALGYAGSVASDAATLLLTVSYTTTLPSTSVSTVLGTASVASTISQGASGGLSTAALAGIVAGSVVGGLLLLLALFCYCRRRRRAQGKDARPAHEPAPLKGALGGREGPWRGSTDPSAKGSETSEAVAALLAGNGVQGALAPWTPTGAATASGSTGAGSAASSRNGHAQALDWVTRSAAAAGSTGGRSAPGSAGGRSAPATPGVDFKMWALNWQDLEIQKQIGEGSFGRVYLAKWNETYVAVKVLIQRGLDPNDPHEATLALSMSNPIMASLHKEAAMMASLRHPNVVGFLGLCTNPPCVASEYCARGSLTDVLRGAARSPAKAAQLDWQRRLNMALDACKGMLYLHSHAPPIIHRDLKSPNLLVDKHWRVKISDFNLSKLLDGESVQSSLAATNPRWLAPEILGRGSATFASDVYAFGMVLWELLTWELPWAGDGPWQVVALVNEGGRPAIPERAALPGPDTRDWEGLDGFTDLIRRCWAQNANDRPTFAEIIPILRDLLEALMIKNQAAGNPPPVIAETPPASEPTSSQPSAAAGSAPVGPYVPGL